MHVIEPNARPFDLKEVRLLAGPFEQAMERDRRYLHELDSDRLLHTWRINAGLPSNARPLGGWEKPYCQLRGHTLGHYLSACALMYSSTGDAQLKTRADAIVTALASCQEALGPTGYLSAFPESFIDLAENCQPVWSPFYVLHKLYAGLQDMYVHCDNRQALDVVCKMANWLQQRLDKLDESRMQHMLERTEQGGMNEALANLYALTGNKQYLAMARRFDQKRYVEPLASGEDKLNGEHANSLIPNIVGNAKLYELSGNERDRIISENLWNLVARTRSYCTGGTSQHEHWQGANQLPLTDFTQESCCTYNMLKLTRHIFCWDSQARYADYYERALWNSILSTQHPQSGMMMYFVPLAGGRWKIYNLPNDAFWCCTGTGIENHAKYGDSIYFHDDSTLFVNQFIASEVDWKAKSVKVRQETAFPERENTKLIVKTRAPVDFSMRIRVPYWRTKGFAVRLNGELREGPAQPCSYFDISRTWQDGDQVEVALPMALHTHPMPDDKTLAALMYGPFVLAGKLGGPVLAKEDTHTSQNWYKFDTPQTMPILLGDINDPAAWIGPVADQPLTFETTEQESDFTLVPYHRLFGEPYAVYWRVYARDSSQYTEHLEQVKREEARSSRRIDRIGIGDAESERTHKLMGENTQTGYATFGRQWRQATEGKWFSYVVKVLPDRPMTLVCTYWGSDADSRTFDILVDDHKIATQTLDKNRPDQYFDAEYDVPARLTRDKQHVTVKFQAHPGATAGGLFDISVLIRPVGPLKGDRTNED